MNFAAFILMGIIMSGTVYCSDTKMRQITSREKETSATEHLGNLEHRAINESSGLAVSRRTPGIMWTHNDSGGLPRLFVSTIEGRHLAIVNVRGASNRDWEDMASYSFDGKDWLLIADVGDNRAVRKQYILYIIEEPEIDLNRENQILEAPVAEKIRFVYEDGARDCEAVGVDTVLRQILLLSKRDVPPVLYSLPIRSEGDDPIIAKRLVAVSKIPRPTAEDIADDPRYGKYRSMPTAMDVNRNGTLAIVITYKDAYKFRRNMGKTWEESFVETPRILPLPKRRQGESGCFSAEGQAVFVGTEGRPAPIWRIPLNK